MSAPAGIEEFLSLCAREMGLDEAVHADDVPVDLGLSSFSLLSLETALREEYEVDLPMAAMVFKPFAEVWAALCAARSSQ